MLENLGQILLPCLQYMCQTISRRRTSNNFHIESNVICESLILLLVHKENFPHQKSPFNESSNFGKKFKLAFKKCIFPPG